MSNIARGARKDRAVTIGLVLACLTLTAARGYFLVRARWTHLGSVPHPELLRITVLRLISDFCTWMASALIGWAVLRFAWRQRRRVTLGMTGYLLVVVLLGFGLKRMLDFDQLRLAMNAVDPRLSLVSAAVSTLIAVFALLLVPFVRQIVDSSLTADSEHDNFIAAAEVNANAFFILESVRNPLGTITDFRFRFANEKGEKLLELKGPGLLEKRLRQFLPAVAENETFGHFVEVVRTGVPYLGEASNHDGRGRERSYSLQAVKMADGVAVVMFDLSEDRYKQKRMEQLHKFSESMIENAPFSIIATDPHGTITAVNAATEQLTLYRKRELVGHHSLVLLHDAAELSARSVAMATELGHTVPAGFMTLTSMLDTRKTDEREWTYVRKDGSRTPVQLSLTTLRGPNNEITGYLAIAFDISERKKLTDSIRYLAHYDSVTNLPNRALLKDRMQAAIERSQAGGKRLAVMMVDLDNFKRINDSLGHLSGDDVLVAVAERVLSAVRRTDTVARMGGDEFVVMLEDLNGEGDALRCANKILERLGQEIAVADHQVNITASIGLCLFPQGGSDSTTLLRNADAAMYEAKERGGNSIATYTGAEKSADASALRTEQELRHASEAGQMQLYYQTQVNCRTGETVAVEALLRWNHPKRGMLSPGDFINTAEETGLVVGIGEWAIQQACNEIKGVQERLGRRFAVAVNISARQFRQKNLPEVVQTALAHSGLNPEDLELEITERTLMVNSAETIAQLSRIRQLGVRISIDDFGTGFSSFKYLLEYRIDALKIDQSFISKIPTDGNAMAIVRSVIAMAHGLNMRVVAEGVEYKDQLGFLLRRHCDDVQGFLFSRPMPATELLAHLRSDRYDMAQLDLNPVASDQLIVARPQ